MKKEKVGKILVAGVLLIGGTVLAGCGKEEAAPIKETAQQNQQTEQTSPSAPSNSSQEVSQEDSLTQAAKDIKAYFDIKAELEKAKNGEDVNYDMVESIYVENLQQNIIGTSSDWDQAIVAAINGGKGKELDTNVIRQLIDKTIQSYFYSAQKKLHKDIAALLAEGKKEDAQAKYEELLTYVEEVQKPTAAKRDDYWKVDMVNQIDLGLAQEKEAIQSGEVTQFKVAGQIVDKTIYRSHYLAVLKYAKAISEDVAAGKTDEVKAEQIEAWGFYQAIYGSLSSGDQEAADLIQKRFSLNEDPANINFEEIDKAFARAFIGKIKGYYEKAPKALEEGNKELALESAMEGNVFLKNIELVSKDYLGEEAANTLLSDAANWFSALEAEDLSKAKTEGDKVLAKLTLLLEEVQK
ncbi:hypothetical protein L1765_13555 [Microaerobacter geothermalis]|uniref:hypothetical protein n=1 Tax=Microaerobacter geothermalis TaxID=674972 RepID=UPI001F445BAF|nr:hypothetical protein [Microaerobacter geothermalis]MCF6094987.1 hypothetical protein [Microaerobacter geothermalis]